MGGGSKPVYDGYMGDLVIISSEGTFIVEAREVMRRGKKSSRIIEVIYELVGGEKYLEISLKPQGGVSQIRLTEAVGDGPSDFDGLGARYVYGGLTYRRKGSGKGHLYIEGVYYGVVQWKQYEHEMKDGTGVTMCLSICRTEGEPGVRTYAGKIIKSSNATLFAREEAG